MSYGLRILMVGLVLACGSFTVSEASAARTRGCGHTVDEFRCVQYVRNYDGDTITVTIPRIHALFGQDITIRLQGIDTGERRSSDACEREASYRAQQEVQRKLQNANRIDLVNVSRGKYFRIVANVKINGRDLTTHLLNNGYGVPYDGGTKPTVNWCRF